MLLVCCGTRPEWIKIKPILDKIEKNKYRLLITGQHTTLLDAQIANYNPLVLTQKVEHTNRLDSIVENVLAHSNIYTKIFEQIKHVMVQGDTTSAFAVALAAFHRKIPIIHLEAGLRSFDLENPYPEEFNRSCISNMASINLCPTEKNKKNICLCNPNSKCYVTGNTVLDNLVGTETSYTNKVLITLHRRENHDLMKDWFSVLNAFAKQNPELEMIFPAHPNPNVQQYLKILKNLKVVTPMSHENLIDILKVSKFVVTDSGGIQEESSFLNKFCIVCRKFTERQEALGKTSVLCRHPKNLNSFCNYANTHYKITKTSCPFGNGRASEIIVDILKQEDVI